MLKAVSKVLFIAIMLVAFIGQTIAFNSAMSCETSENSLLAHAKTHNNINTSEQKKHINSILTTDNTSQDCCGIECCDIDCACVANACSSFMYIETDSRSPNKTILNEVVYSQRAEQPKAIANLLYRPPIFIS